ncbi:hypothetical protein [Gloeocapsa sp. PCC 73106]|uniref:hypothetical protein n=1 Tax=Gloeocapsa sp. PCC 73106 TaxID=102232 RepID=UPI0002ACFD27|nr:hypothetical protein [Gloeocapsa sp. PCC 73106]ELR99472.1 hypothetical protein GLO73106DRAFT_00033230 [Gloeocapsa sp. PCC 73106]
MNNSDDFAEEKLNQIKLLIYFIPIVGIVPALWTLSRTEPTPTEKRLSRISVQLAIAWMIAYSLLWLGASQSSDLLSFRLLYLNGLLTSGYFLTCLIMLLSLGRDKLPKSIR